MVTVQFQRAALNRGGSEEATMGKMRSERSKARAKLCLNAWWKRVEVPAPYQKHMGPCRKVKGHRGECGEATQ